MASLALVVVLNFVLLRCIFRCSLYILISTTYHDKFGGLSCCVQPMRKLIQSLRPGYEAHFIAWPVYQAKRNRKLKNWLQLTACISVTRAVAASHNHRKLCWRNSQLAFLHVSGTINFK